MRYLLLCIFAHLYKSWLVCGWFENGTVSSIFFWRLFFKYDLIYFIIHMNMSIQKLTTLLASILLLSENNLEMVSMYLKLGFQYSYYSPPHMPQYVYFFIQVINFSCHNASFLIAICIPKSFISNQENCCNSWASY